MEARTMVPVIAGETEDLALDAAMAMLARYGGLWSSDYEHVRRHLAVIIEAARELADDYPAGDDRAEATLRHILTTDLPPE
jgi:hypothetical protein